MSPKEVLEMNKNLINIYSLIMLECRLSLEDASKIFSIDRKVLEEYLLSSNNSHFRALQYLVYYEAPSFRDNPKGKWKATLLVRKLYQILKNSNKDERIVALNDYIKMLQSPDLSFIGQKNKFRYTKEEKEKVLKFRLKYAASSTMLPIDHSRIEIWEKELEEGEFKTRLGLLREYLQSIRFKNLRK